MKKTKKTILAMLLTGALIFSAFILGGCGEKDGSKSSDLISATDSNGTKWPDSSVAQILPVPVWKCFFWKHRIYPLNPAGTFLS